ncbi:MAG: peptidase and chymotrypsin/Hap [Nocardioidaceae bacterium]|jgi:S1-C subfamily serine protease|nr:peptidase and chymotrypsin/Hap [Nocardioidaceae bacterium]
MAMLLVAGLSIGGTALWLTRDSAPDASAGRAKGGDGNNKAPQGDAPASGSPTDEDPGGTPTDFADTYSDVESGVLRILASTCEGDGIGTGFLLGPRTIATAAHVVEGAGAVAVDVPSGPRPAQVVGIDPVTDLAVLRVDGPIRGHVFSLADADPTPGTTVAAIGFPLDEPKTLTIGVVSGLDRTIRIDGRSRTGLLQTDTAINPGNSGGPLVTTGGEVVGVVDALRLRSQGIGYAVQISTAAPSLAAPASMPAPAAPDCAETEGPTQLTVRPQLVPPEGPVTLPIQDTLAAYYNGINAGDYYTVVEQFAPTYPAIPDPSDLAESLATSFDFGAVIRDVTGTPSRAQAWVTFVSVQAPRFGPDGEGCTEWSLDYTFVEYGGRMLIDDVEAHSGDGHTPC